MSCKVVLILIHAFDKLIIICSLLNIIFIIHLFQGLILVINFLQVDGLIKIYRYFISITCITKYIINRYWQIKETSGFQRPLLKYSQKQIGVELKYLKWQDRKYPCQPQLKVCLKCKLEKLITMAIDHIQTPVINNSLWVQKRFFIQIVYLYYGKISRKRSSLVRL